jgi:predicted phosphodiesterase
MRQFDLLRKPYFYPMKIALLADIHGNAIALDAVLEDIEREGGVDAHWILGDLVAIGPDPIGVLQQISALDNTTIIRGNTDRYVATNDRPGPGIAEVQANPALLKPLIQVANTFAWTQGMVTAAGWLPWLAKLPLDFEMQLPDGTRFLGVHASPGTDDGTGISPASTDEEIETLFNNCHKDLVCVGHTHLPLDRKWEKMHLVNPGSVGLSRTPDLHACYAMLETETDGYRIQHRRVPFDRQAVIDQLINLAHPARDYIIHHLTHQL